MKEREKDRAVRIDATDRALVAALQAEGRASWAELGRQVRLSAPSVQERVRRLESAGVITGYHASVDAAALGLGMVALVGIHQTDSADQDDVADQLELVPEVEDCWLVAGEETFVVKVRVADVDALERALRALRRVPGVARTRTTVVISTRWQGRPLPGSAAPPPSGTMDG
jgi:Lrp/AsnC family leucine-responsive transcriptional regulator